MNEIVELLKQKKGVLDVVAGFNEITIIFEDGSEFSFKAEGYEGTSLEVSAKVFIEKKYSL